MFKGSSHAIDFTSRNSRPGGSRAPARNRSNGFFDDLPHVGGGQAVVFPGAQNQVKRGFVVSFVDGC
jgi:hypothetical protein